MIPYFIILLISTILGTAAYKVRSSPLFVFIILALLFFILVTFAGVRDWSVGGDTLNYRDMFVYKRGELSWAQFVGGLDPGFVVFQNLMQKLTTSFVVYLFAIASLVIGLSLIHISEPTRPY